jgi:hypothetical protein
MMLRASPFRPFLGVMALSLPDRLDQLKFMASSQAQLDRIDPGTYADSVLTHPWPGTDPDRRVLLQIGLGDLEVPNAASFFHARALGVTELTPNPAAIEGLSQTSGPFLGSAISLYDFGVDLHAVYDQILIDVPDNGVHEGVRLLPAVLHQIDAFMRPDGLVVD